LRPVWRQHQTGRLEVESGCLAAGVEDQARRECQAEGHCAVRFLRGDNTDAGRLAGVIGVRED
jgi:hypothetical protein